MRFELTAPTLAILGRAGRWSGGLPGIRNAWTPLAPLDRPAGRGDRVVTACLYLRGRRQLPAYNQYLASDMAA